MLSIFFFLIEFFLFCFFIQKLPVNKHIHLGESRNKDFFFYISAVGPWSNDVRAVRIKKALRRDLFTHS